MRTVIIGGLHHNTLGVIRSLGEEGIRKSSIRVVIVDEHYSDDNIISRCKYITKENIFYVSSNDKVPLLLIQMATTQEKAVVICCSDGSAEAVIGNHDILCDSYYLPSTKIDIHELMSKETQNELANQFGLNCPISKVVSVDDTIEWDVFPCIIKPLTSASGMKSDIRISRTKKELYDSINGTVAQVLQIQEYVEKAMEYQLIGCSLDDGNTVIIPGYTRIIRQPDYTNTGYLCYSSIKELNYNSRAVSSFLKALGYNGLFSIEFLRGKDGKDYFLEINMRNDGNAYCVKSAGVNLPFIWCYYQSFGKMPSTKLEFDTPVFFIPDWSDFRRGIRSVGFLRWINQFYNAESHAVFNRHDMGPFILQTEEMVVYMIKFLFRKFGNLFNRRKTDELAKN